MLACSSPAPAPDRILLVTIDTLRADHVGCYGAGEGRTPRIDTVAAGGVRFEVALSPVPLTLPAHASLFTAVDPPTHGVRHNSIHRLPPELPTLPERLRAGGYATAAFVGALVLDRRFGLDRGFDVYDDRTAGRVSASTGYAERPADAVVDAALAWLETAPERWFLWVHFYDPHMGWTPPPAYRALFAGSPYAGEIAFADSQLGRLLDALETRFGAQGTLVAISSDHGESLGEHGEPTHSYTLYEATQRIPLLLAGPGLPTGAVAAGPASLLDVAPTLLALAGLPPLPGARGRDLRGLLAETLATRPVYMETLATQLDFGWSPLLAVRSGRWKYVRAPRAELYDLATDADELRNLAAEQPERLRELDAELARLASAPARAPLPASVGPEDRERLRSLGYVVPEPAHAASALGRVGGPDPKDHLDALEALSQALGALEEQRPEEALALLDGIESDAPHVAVHRAAAALASGDAVRARREAEAALTREPARSDARILLARALDRLEGPRAGDAALAELPADFAPAAWIALRAARGEARAGNRDAAESRLAAARARHPRDAALASAHADLLEAAGQLERALEARELALAVAPSPASRNDVAWTLARLERDLERARSLVRQALAEQPDAPALLDTLATVHLALGEREQAAALSEHALPLADGPTRAHLEEIRRAATRAPR